MRDDCEVEGPFWMGELVAELANRWSSALRASALRFISDTSPFVDGQCAYRRRSASARAPPGSWLYPDSIS